MGEKRGEKEKERKKTSDQPKLRDILQNAWPDFLNVREPKNMERGKLLQSRGN